MTAASHRRIRTTPLLAVPLLFAAGGGTLSFLRDTGPGPTRATVDGAALFTEQCAACHGVDGSGVTGRGPDIRDEGEAAADFVLRTGRMPMADPSMQARRGPVRYDEDEIVALVGFVGSLGDGPAIPDVDVTSGHIAAGSYLYRINCAACHVASGAGAAIGGGQSAPSLMASTPTEIGEAIRVGPGAMPSFDSFSDQDLDDVATYIGSLQRSDVDGSNSFGGIGPVGEGLAAWLLGLLPIVALTRWIGRPRQGAGATPDGP